MNILSTERAIDKIKKCLALSHSSNANEAAQALKHAQALMRQYGVDEALIADADLDEVTVATRSRSARRPSNWERHLVGLVGKAFGCRLMFVQARAGGRYHYVGLREQAAVAAYTATVLLRQLRAARARHVATQKSVWGGLSRAAARSLGDAFCVGWLWKVSDQVTAFANPAALERAIEARVRSRCGERRTKSATFKDRYDAVSVSAGVAAAESVSLHRPVRRGQDAPALVHVEQ